MTTRKQRAAAKLTSRKQRGLRDEKELSPTYQKRPGPRSAKKELRLHEGNGGDQDKVEGVLVVQPLLRFNLDPKAVASESQ